MMLVNSTLSRLMYHLVLISLRQIKEELEKTALLEVTIRTILRGMPSLEEETEKL